MRSDLKLLIIVMVGLLSGAANKPLSVRFSDIPDGVIIGNLGKPLGIVCRIRGIAHKPPGHRSKVDSDSAIDLVIDSVDGAKLNGPFIFTFPDGVHGLNNQPAPEQPFNYAAYETGYFVGPISDPNKLALQNNELFTQNNFGPFYNLRLELNIVKPTGK